MLGKFSEEIERRVFALLLLKLPDMRFGRRDGVRDLSKGFALPDS
jgi:hypothetical protein